MFCPSCRSEYRTGILRCATCDIALVDEVTAAPPQQRRPSIVAEEPADDSEPMASYCGFLTLEDARAARDQLRGKSIPAEIVIRDAAHADPDLPLQEEFWLRVPPVQLRIVEQILGFQPVESPVHDPEEEGEFACSNCGGSVADHESACPNCGAKFDE